LTATLHAMTKAYWGRRLDKQLFWDHQTTMPETCNNRVWLNQNSTNPSS